MKPSLDDLASVLVAVLPRELSTVRIRFHVALTPEATKAALAYLTGRGTVRNSGGGWYRARQRICAGACQREAREIRCREVIVDPETLRWFCADCWREEVEQIRLMVEA